MAQSEPGPLRKLPLDAQHRAAGACMVPQAGWMLPDAYAGADTEHRAVRTRAGLFDASFVGELEVAGRDAASALQRVTCSNAAGLRVGQSQRSAFLSPSGAVIDLVRVCRLAERHFLVVTSAPDLAADLAHLQHHVSGVGDAVVVDTSSRYALLAVAGPEARDVLQQVTEIELADLEPECFANGEILHARGTIIRAEMLGEEGFAVLLPPQQAPAIWKALLETGDDGVVPVGLAAQGTLRLEAGQPLHGQDIDDRGTILEAGLEALVGWDHGDFVGREALTRQRAEGVPRRLVGVQFEDQTGAVPGSQVVADGKPVGTVTSAARTPSVAEAIGLVSLPAALAAPGTWLDVERPGQRSRACVVTLPFYNRSKR